MPLMLLAILYISLSQFPIMDYQKVLSIVFLSGLCKIERRRVYCLSINDDNLVVGYGVFGIYFNRYTTVREKSC